MNYEIGDEVIFIHSKMRGKVLDIKYIGFWEVKVLTPGFIIITTAEEVRKAEPEGKE